MARQESPYRKYLDKRLFTRVRILIIFAGGFFAATIYVVLIIRFDLLWAATSILLGIMVGIVVSRMFHLSWDDENQHVVSNMDWIGAIIFVLYIIFIIGRSVILGYWVHGATYFGVIFSITAGVMIGRIMGTRHTILKIKEDLQNIRKSLS